METSVDYVPALLGMGFKVTWIAHLLDVKVHSLRYHLKKNNISAKRIEEMSDVQLDNRVAEIVSKFPNAGHKMMSGLFASSHGHPYVTRDRLRASLNRVRVIRNDPPRMDPIKRRKYAVKAPLTLWHIDGHHKLIKWGVVIHGGIDGYSRLITFLGVSFDNKAMTVLNHFLDGVLKYGLPVSVRSDYGLENVGVADLMIAARDHEARDSFLTGKSTQNQRIERLWRDVFSICLDPFYSLFSDMERDGFLNISNPVDWYVLRTVVKKLLESTVEDFQHGWNQHPISTVKKNFTPAQLFTSGLLHLRKMGGHHPELIQEKTTVEYAAKEAYIMREFTAAGKRKPLINVPFYPSPLTSEEETVLFAYFDPAKVTLENLKDQYFLVKYFVVECLNRRIPSIE